MLVQSIRIELIEIPKERIRIRSGLDLMDLIESIKIHGLLHPILLNKKDGKYILISGFRRLSAFGVLGLEEIPAVIKEGLNEFECHTLELEENLKRQNLTPFEIDTAFAKLKTLQRKLYPETRHGGDRKSDDFKQQKKNQTVRSATRKPLLINSPKDDSPPEPEENRVNMLIEELKKETQLSDRTIRNRTKVGTAIIEKTLDEKTIEEYKEGKMTHTQVLNKIKIKKEKKQRDQESIPKTVHWCKDCEDARVTPCPNCGKQVIVCSSSKTFVLYPADAKLCNKKRE